MNKKLLTEVIKDLSQIYDEMLIEWISYVPEYFRKKYKFDEDLASILEMIKKYEKMRDEPIQNLCNSNLEIE